MLKDSFNNDYAAGFEAQGLEFSPTLPRAFVMEKSVSAIIAQAAAMGNKNR